ncbi:ABC transporter permease [Halobacteriales archaeon QH_10_67_22]|nr:MAG: ABC transporter permease [Halobacteriales archaeon QH_10_67_22]
MVGLAAGIIDATVRAATPLILASLGEIISERGGVLNLGVEGMMLVGALCGFATTFTTGSPWIGFAVGTLAGAAMATIHAVLCISLKADQVISGVMLTLLGTGLTTYFGQEWVSKSIDGFETVAVPVVGDALVGLPLVGPALFENTPTDYLALALVPAVGYLLFRTSLGLEITAVGENPEAADTMGVPVFAVRYLCVILGGAFAGAAGAHLSLAFSKLWVTGMTAGRGWIAIALVIFAQWRPWRALVGAYLFGGIEAFVLRSQALDPTVTGIPLAETIDGVVSLLLRPQVMSMYPYLATVVVLVLATRRVLDEQVGAPSALLDNYSRETE